MKKDYLLLRQVLGLLGILLPFAVILFGLLGDNKPGWWHSISATFYANSSPLFVMLMGAVGLFLITYGGAGYGLLDTIINRLSGVFAILIICFPCFVPMQERAGLFNLPIGISNTIHCISAGVFFALLAFNILFLFTKSFTKEKRHITDKKGLRNKIYYCCGSVIVAAMISQAITAFFGPGWATIINEAFMLIAFGVAWLVKGEAIKRFNDKGEKVNARR